jgi:hypothetical protein
MTDTPTTNTEGERKVPRFSLGQIVSTRGALAVCLFERITCCLARHVTADWGCLDAEDARANNEALITGDRIISAYPINPAKPSEGFGENTLWIITEADRSVTTVLLPDEY